MNAPDIIVLDSNGDSYKEAFEEYMGFQRLKHDTREILELEAEKLSFQLYKETLAVTKTKAELFAIPPAVGWRIRRLPGWAVFDISSQFGRKTLALSRPRVRKDGTIVQKIMKLKPFITKPGEMNRRAKGLGVTARGWLVRKWGRWRKDGTRELHRVRNPQGQVIYDEGDSGVISITIINVLPGMPGLEERFFITGRAIANRVDSIAVYLARKIADNAAQLGEAMR